MIGNFVNCFTVKLMFSCMLVNRYFINDHIIYNVWKYVLVFGNMHVTYGSSILWVYVYVYRTRYCSYGNL